MIKSVTSNTKFIEDPKSRSGLTGVLGVFILSLGTVFAYNFFMTNFVLSEFLLDLGLIVGLCLLITIVIFLAFTARRQHLIGKEGQLAIKNRFKSTLDIQSKINLDFITIGFYMYVIRELSKDTGLRSWWRSMMFYALAYSMFAGLMRLGKYPKHLFFDPLWKDVTSIVLLYLGLIVVVSVFYIPKIIKNKNVDK